MTWAPIPQTTPALRFFAVTIAAAARRMSAAPSIAGSESSHVLKDAPRGTERAKSSAFALLLREFSGYVRMPVTSNSSYRKGIGARSEYQHCVSVAVKAVSRFHRLAVGGEKAFTSCEC